jgi:NAD(P)-dependent dehydrogenase (short-subunit alcohol dehydrogenase family)
MDTDAVELARSRWSGGTAVITGAGRGLGAGMARAAASFGMSVLVADLDAASARAIADELNSSGAHALAAQLDVTDADAVEQLADTAYSTFGDVRLLVNNAGHAFSNSMLDLDFATWRRDIALNLDSAFLCTRAFQEHLLAHGGVIVNMGSVNGLSGTFGHPAYSAAKAGLMHFTQCLAVEYGPHGVRVNAVAPGTVRTRAWDGRLAANPQVFEEVTAWYPLRKVATPLDVARAVAFLASDEASHITGIVLPVDGGITAGLTQLHQSITQQK